MEAPHHSKSSSHLKLIQEATFFLFFSKPLKTLLSILPGYFISLLLLIRYFILNKKAKKHSFERCQHFLSTLCLFVHLIKPNTKYVISRKAKEDNLCWACHFSMPHEYYILFSRSWIRFTFTLLICAFPSEKLTNGFFL